MSLRIVYGRAGSGKTHFILNEIKSRIEGKSDKTLVFLVPEQFSFQAEKDLVSATTAGGILRTEVLSFQRMAYRIFNETGGITYPHIHPAGKSMIIFQILNKMKDKFKVFSGTCEREGFVNTISTLITEFKRYSITPEHIKTACEALAEDDPLRDKLAEINLIYSEFENLISRKYRDTDDDLTLAAKKIFGSSLYDGAEIWIDGFISFTPQEYKMIGELLKKADRVTVSLCTDTLDISAEPEDADVFSPVKHVYMKLKRIADENGATIEEPVFLGEPSIRFRNSIELAHLEKNLYAYPYKTFDKKTKDISIYEAMNIFSEIEATASDIIRLCRDHGMRYRDIAVITGNLPAYEKLVEIIFSEYDIPYFIDRKADISNHPVIRLLLSMLDIFIENWSYESVFRYLKTGLTGIDQSSIDKLENYVLACGIRGGYWTREEEWDMSEELIPGNKQHEEHQKELDEINAIRNKIVGPLLEFRNKTKGKRTAMEFSTGIYDFLCGLDIPETIEKSIEKIKEQGELDLANEYSQVWNIVMEVLDQIVEVIGDEPSGLERFSEILKVALAEYKIGTIPAALDQVLIGSVERSRSHEIKAMFLLGVNDGVFPSSAVIEGILSDQDRSVLHHIGIELAGDTRAQAFDEQHIVYRTLTIAGEYLRISYPIGDSEGRTMRPSIIVSRLKKLFPKITHNSNLLASSSKEFDIEWISRQKPAFKKLITALRQKADGKGISPAWKEVYLWFSADENWKRSIGAIKEAFKQKNLAEKISREKVGLLYGNPVYSSVSQLEKYTSCPFAFFVQYGLMARERKIYRLSPPDIGTFIHAVIESFSKMVSQEDLSWRSFDDRWCKARVSEIVDGMLENMKGKGIAASKRYTALTKRLKRIVTRAVQLIAEHIKRSSFNPIEYEVGFGEREKYPSIVIELDSGEKIQLTGRIDRIDAFETQEGKYFNIIDYKSGSREFKLADVFYGLQIQLIAYMDAIWESEEKECGSPVFPGGVLYFNVDDPIIKNKKDLSEDELKKAIMKKLKMKGLILADVKLIKEMDNTIGGSSMLIPATVNKGDVLGKNTSGATFEQFKAIRKYIRRLLKDICTEIMKGNTDIKPYKKKNISSCTYCSFLSVCQFDTTRKENSFRLLYNMDNDQVWKNVEEKIL
ncbi:MAG: helicase-exonuclease AddAB subunit AddB [Acetivibrionales bacterium]|jgi:ATP-dependent helicase/nuclease subunit B